LGVVIYSLFVLDEGCCSGEILFQQIGWNADSSARKARKIHQFEGAQHLQCLGGVWLERGVFRALATSRAYSSGKIAPPRHP
jgi:hypothetical protein